MTSNAELQHLNLIDLLHERHHLIEKVAEEEWNDQHDIRISNSEWYIMAHIYKQQPAISYITKNVDISRQAIHKFIKNLSTKGLLEVHKMENNKKEKYIELTTLGEECYEARSADKSRLEEEISKHLGLEQVQMLKDILRLDWGIG